jgi:hypothetical protein
MRGCIQFMELSGIEGEFGFKMRRTVSFWIEVSLRNKFFTKEKMIILNSSKSLVRAVYVPYSIK